MDIPPTHFQGTPEVLSSPCGDLDGETPHLKKWMRGHKHQLRTWDGIS